MRDFLLLMLLLAATVLGQPLDAVSRPSGQAQPGGSPAAQTTLAVIFGQVVDGDTGDAIPDAVVTLTGRPAPARGRQAATPPATRNLLDLIAARGRGRGSAEQVAADGEGRFVFRDLPASRYTLRPAAPGYLPSAGGLTGRGGTATVEIAAGDTAARVVVRMWKEAIITGRVLDETSEPIIRARVTADRLNVTRFGEVTYDQSGSALTDDRGEYRMYGLLPGTYLVAVPQSQQTALAAGADAMLQSLLSGQMPEGGLGALSAGSSPMDPNAVRIGEFRLSSDNVQSPPPPGDGPLRAYRTMYHAAALSPETAVPVILRSGEERSGIDFALTPVVTGRITGTVTGPSGPAAHVPVRAMLADASPGAPSHPAAVASGQTSADGRFTLLAVPPGQYRVVAEREAPDLGDIPEELASNPMIKMAMAMQAAGAGTPLYGEAAANVGDGETVELAIAGSEGVTVTGEVRFDGAPPPAADIERIRVALRALGRGTSGVRLIRVGQDGRFTAEGVFPGRYVASSVATVGGSPRLIREVIAGGRDATTSPIVVENDDLAMAVTFTDRVGSVRGTVRRESTRRMAQAAAESRPLTAIVVPADYTTWTSLETAAERVSLAPVAEDDTFRAGPLLAGEYLVVVIDESAIDMSGGLAALRAIAAQATRVTVGTGDSALVTVGIAGGRR